MLKACSKGTKIKKKCFRRPGQKAPSSKKPEEPTPKKLKKSNTKNDLPSDDPKIKPKSIDQTPASPASPTTPAANEPQEPEKDLPLEESVIGPSFSPYSHAHCPSANDKNAKVDLEAVIAQIRLIAPDLDPEV